MINESAARQCRLPGQIADEAAAVDLTATATTAANLVYKTIVDGRAERRVALIYGLVKRWCRFRTCCSEQATVECENILGKWRMNSMSMAMDWRNPTQS